MENDGELTEDEVFKCLSNLGQSATGLQHTYLCLSVPVSDQYTHIHTLIFVFVLSLWDFHCLVLYRLNNIFYQ